MDHIFFITACNLPLLEHYISWTLYSKAHTAFYRLPSQLPFTASSID